MDGTDLCPMIRCSRAAFDVKVAILAVEVGDVLVFPASLVVIRLDLVGLEGLLVGKGGSAVVALVLAVQAIGNS